MSVSGAIDIHQFQAEFAAYTKLTLANRVQARVWGQSVPERTSMSFEQFLNAIKNDKIVDPNYAREVPSAEIRSSAVNASMNGNPSFESRKFDIIRKAYELGLVDYHGLLLSEFHARA